ncbi:hypothetical protein Vretimale_17059, partial [Volvox reticuliferus]
PVFGSGITARSQHVSHGVSAWPVLSPHTSQPPPQSLRQQQQQSQKQQPTELAQPAQGAKCANDSAGEAAGRGARLNPIGGSWGCDATIAAEAVKAAAPPLPS